MFINTTNIVLRKNISQFEILHVNMDSNATNVQHVTTQLHGMTFHNTNDVTIGALVIFTQSVNIDEGIINSETIVVTSITKM